jgi:hypothetical protein
MKKIMFRVSQATDIEPATITKRIVSELDKPGYIILRKSNEIIEFKYNIWRVGSRSRVLGKVDGGRFQIIAEENRVVLNFSYYVSPFFWILISSFFIFIGIFQDYHILYFILGILVMYFFKVENVRSAGAEMMKNILKPA